MSNTQLVRAVMQRLGSATRPELRAHLPDIAPRTIGHCLASLVEQGEIESVGVAQRKTYRMLARTAPAGTSMQRARAAVQMQPSGYPPGYFTRDAQGEALWPFCAAA